MDATIKGMIANCPCGEFKKTKDRFLIWQMFAYSYFFARIPKNPSGLAALNL